MRKTLVTLLPILGMLLALSGVVLPMVASAHTTVPTVVKHEHTPAFTCFGDACDGVMPAGAVCGGSAERVYDTPMVAHNGTTVGHLYLYDYPWAGCDAPFWGTFHLSSSIKSGNVYTTRGNTTDDPIIDESRLYTNPSVGVYHDSAMLGCDFDYPGPSDNFNAAIDWTDAQGYQLHTQTTTSVDPSC